MIRNVSREVGYITVTSTPQARGRVYVSMESLLGRAIRRNSGSVGACFVKNQFDRKQRERPFDLCQL